MSSVDDAITGVAAGVPYVALPPLVGHRDAAPLIIAWPLNNPPRSAAAMAAALPLHRVSAWRVYLDLPMHGASQLLGGLNELMQMGYQDAALHAIEPQVSQAVEEFPAARAVLRDRLAIPTAPLGLLGASIGALPALLVMATGTAPVSAAALISPAIQLAEVIAVNEHQYGVSYSWSDVSRAATEKLDLVARAAEIADREPQPALLMVTGPGDEPAFARQTQLLQAALRPWYRDARRVSVTTIADKAYAFASEPGAEPAKQTPAGATRRRRCNRLVQPSPTSGEPMTAASPRLTRRLPRPPPPSRRIAGSESSGSPGD